MVYRMGRENDQIVFISSYPSRECGIATFCQDLIHSLSRLFTANYDWQVCALEENETDNFLYPPEVKYRLKTDEREQYINFARLLNHDDKTAGICIQHEFGLFGGNHGDFLLDFLKENKKPVVIIFHSVIPDPNPELRQTMVSISKRVDQIIVMTNNSASVLIQDYELKPDIIKIIPHGTHHISWDNQKLLKQKYNLEDLKVISTFGLISENKSIETALFSLPEIIKIFPDIVYLIIGKTHPKVAAKEGERYRNLLEEIVTGNCLENHVRFINQYLKTTELLEYLQLSDVYLFTSKDPNQAVSGTFAYALSCGCPVISTPIPHARELLDEDVGQLINFGDHKELANTAIKFFSDQEELNRKSLAAYKKSQQSVWQNVAIQFMQVFHNLDSTQSHWTIGYNPPTIEMHHFRKLVDELGIIQFSHINVPDPESGYTLDDNARAMIAMILHYLHTNDASDLPLIGKFLDFIRYCQLDNGRFFNYLDSKGNFHIKNHYVDLGDSNGRAVWALGFLLSKNSFLPPDLIRHARGMIYKTLPWVAEVESPRSIAFTIKGLYYFHKYESSEKVKEIIIQLADRLLMHYQASNQFRWRWFENYLTYANAVIPEAIIMAYEITGNSKYLDVALSSFNFLLSQLFHEDQIRVISNRGWLSKGDWGRSYGEQPIDVACTIMALDTFRKITELNYYLEYQKIAFSWFLGNNRISRIMFDINTGGCYDGLEDTGPNMNQGAESTICFLISRLVMAEENECWDIIDESKHKPDRIAEHQ